MSKRSLLVTRALPAAVLEEAAKNFELRLWERDEPIGDHFEAMARGCDAVLVMATDRLDRTRLQALATHARAVATYSVGYDHIDLEAATACALPVFNTPDVLSDAVAEIALFLIFDPSCQVLTPFFKRKGKSNGIRCSKKSEGLHAGF